GLLAGDALLRELVLHDDLGDEPGVVRARHIERRLTTHPVVASHEVLVPGKAEGVAQVQIAGDVRKRQHHHERLLHVFVGREEARALPPLVEIGFDGGRPEVLLREIERRLRRSFVSRHQLLTPSRKQKRRLVQGRAASWYHPGFARKRSPCLIPLYRADPIRLARDLPNLSRGTLSPVRRLLYRCEARTPPGRGRSLNRITKIARRTTVVASATSVAA